MPYGYVLVRPLEFVDREWWPGLDIVEFGRSPTFFGWVPTFKRSVNPFIDVVASHWLSLRSALRPLRDAHATSILREPATTHRHACEPSADKLDHPLDGEAVREHQRLGRAIVRRGGEQFERAAAVRFGRRRRGWGME
jgi:hypothetical protein